MTELAMRKPERSTPGKRSAPLPSSRRLRAFAFDPSFNLNMDDWMVNQVVINVPWEEENSLDPEEGFGLGPRGEYLEVVDIDPASQLFYPPVDLNDLRLVAQDGLPPDEGSPQFHQQMVYAIAMATIQRFERALGRCALWAPRSIRNPKTGEIKQVFVRRLRVYPHALRQANAYYSPNKKALLFGYFQANPADPTSALPGGTTFTCLSHDIIVHETTHALLDGLQRLYLEPSNPDVLAFHEAFADIVALFQHFSYPEVLRSQIARTRGNLTEKNMLSNLAHQFGIAIGKRGALRSALDEPDVTAYQTELEPHNRGAILVGAVFNAFVAMYKNRTAPLLRLATGGTGTLPPGELPVELVNQLAHEGAKAAGHVLNICIRAQDYLPPIDVTFGEFLRALITADVDVVPDDPHGYRIAFIEAFRRYAVYPHDVRNLSVESLLWDEPDEEAQASLMKLIHDYDPHKYLTPNWLMTSNRKEVFDQCVNARRYLKGFLEDFLKYSENYLKNKDLLHHLWLTGDPQVLKTVEATDSGLPKLEVVSIRPAHRISPNGDALTDLIISIHQRRGGYLNPDQQKEADRNGMQGMNPDFWVYGGCTLLIDLSKSRVRYVLGKCVDSERRLQVQRNYILERCRGPLSLTYLMHSRPVAGLAEDNAEPLALLHVGV